MYLLLDTRRLDRLSSARLSSVPRICWRCHFACVYPPWHHSCELLLASRFVLPSRHPPKLSFLLPPLGFLNIWSWMTTRSVHSKRSSLYSSAATWGSLTKVLNWLNSRLTSVLVCQTVHSSATCLRNITAVVGNIALLVMLASKEGWTWLTALWTNRKELYWPAHQSYKGWAVPVDAAEWWPNVLTDV